MEQERACMVSCDSAITKLGRLGFFASCMRKMATVDNSGVRWQADKIDTAVRHEFLQPVEDHATQCVVP
eukprot:11030839-Ditylum_brightwellii.AAC.1